MPAVDPSNNRSTPRPKKRPKYTVTVPDRKDPTRSRRMPTVTPDQADRQRSPQQKAKDRRTVTKNVQQARAKVIVRGRREKVSRAITAPIRVQQGTQKTVSAAEAARLRRQGVPVRTRTKAERNDVGATQRSIGGAGGGLTRAPIATAIGLGQNPKKSLPATARGFRDALTGIPSGIASLISDPAGTLKGAIKDYDRRYSSLSKPGGIKKTADRITKEGAAPEILDASILVSGGGSAVGRALTKPAAAGKLGKKLERVATEARPEKRVSGGKTVRQEKSANLVVAAGQRVRDQRRVGKNQRKVAQAETRGQRVGAVQQQAARAGEVVAKPREARKIVAREKGRDLERMKREQRTEVDQGTRRALGGLSKHERAGFAVAMKLGIPADAATARRVLEKRRAQIAKAREEEGVSVPRVLRDSNDELVIIERLLGEADKVFTPRLRAVVKGEQARERRVASGDPGLDPVQAQLRRYAPQAAYLGIKRADGETDGAYLRRVVKAARAEGLERPGYFVSQKRPRASNADRAIGGSRAIADPKQYTGALFRTGREDNRPEVFEQGVARNIKRKWNWNLVAKNFDEHTFNWSKDKTVSELLDELDKRGIDPESVALWNPRRYYAQRQTAEAKGPEGDVTGRGEEPTVGGLDKAVDDSAFTLKDLATRPEEFRKSAGWSVVPKAIFDEIHADTRPSGAIARGWDIAKGKQSRILLGLSPAWLQFQVASNGLLMGLAGTGAVDFAKAQAWWAKLPDEQKAAIEPFIGTGAFQDSIQQTKLGAARTRSEKVNQMIDGYRAMKTTPFMQKVGRGNPLDMLFRADAAQNNMFRKAVLYSQVKRDAYKRMGESTKRMAGIQTRFMHTLDLGPIKAMDEIVKDQRALERHAQHVNDFLGDYQTYTASERRGFQRAVMFYGFLRFSLRFTFMTMPIKHPIMSSIIAQLGRLQVDEVRKLLGGDELPWALGKFYFTKDGQLKSIDLSRANPAMNAITNFRAPKDLLGFLPPIAGALIDQAYAKSGFKQREWRVEGENQPRKGQDGYGVENRVRIFLQQMLSLAAPYRAAMEATQPGPKGDDSLLGSPRPTEYKDPQTLYSIAASQANKPQTPGGRLAQQFLPFIPRNDDAPELAASIRARNGEDTGAAPRTVAPAPTAAAPTRAQLELQLRQRLSTRSASGADAAELELRRRLSQR